MDNFYSNKEDGHFDLEWMMKYMMDWKIYCSLRKTKCARDAVWVMVEAASDMLYASDDEHDCRSLVSLLSRCWTRAMALK